MAGRRAGAQGLAAWTRPQAAAPPCARPAAQPLHPVSAGGRHRRRGGVGQPLRGGERARRPDAGDPQPHALHTLQVRGRGRPRASVCKSRARPVHVSDALPSGRSSERTLSEQESRAGTTPREVAARKAGDRRPLAPAGKTPVGVACHRAETWPLTDLRGRPGLERVNRAPPLPSDRGRSRYASASRAPHPFAS